MKKPKTDLTGKRFGDWEVLYEEPQEKYRRKWRCRCVCGKESSVWQDNLTRGLSTGCGCRAIKARADKTRTHGKRHTRLYTVWCNMRRRCYYTADSSYKNYGGRGITVCDEWLGHDGFQNFWNWAYASGYDENAPKGQCTLDRINVNGNYCPENCRWITMGQQARNKQNTVWVEFGGERVSLTDFSEQNEVSHGLAWGRLNRGWEPLDTMFVPPKQTPKLIEYNGEIHSQRGWAKRLNMSHSRIQYRLSHGWTVEEALGVVSPPDWKTIHARMEKLKPVPLPDGEIF